MTVTNNDNGKHGYSLFEIMVYIWRGKYFIGAFVAIGMILAIIAYALSARIYVSTAVVRVGKIANVQLESEVMIRNSVLSEANLFDPAVHSVYVTRNGMSSTGSENDLDGYLVVDIVVESWNSIRAANMCGKLSESLVKRHGKVFNESIARLRKNMKDFGGDKPALALLDTYSFPTTMQMMTPAVDHRRVAGRFNLPDVSLSYPSTYPVILKLLLGTFLSLFAGAVLIWLMVEYIRDGDWKRLMRKIRR